MSTEALDELADSGTLGERVFEAILDLIYTGELAPGSRLNEAALALRFGVSRGPVREAIRRLQGTRLVTREPFVKARVVQPTRGDTQNLFEIREALEGYACRLASQRMSDADLQSLASELERERRAYAAGGVPESIANFDFHERIALASGNERLQSTLFGDLYHLLRLTRRLAGHVPTRKDAAYVEHWEIVRALQARDADLSESLMRRHIRGAATHIITSVFDSEPKTPDVIKRKRRAAP
jgi:DNA-binding GntR family transcriptional regulator